MDRLPGDRVPKLNKEYQKPSAQPFVVYWNSIPSPYMIDRFNALADRNTIEFEAWFSDRTESDRSWEIDESKWRFRYKYLPTSTLFGRVLHWPVYILGRRPDVLVCLHAQPAFVIGWLIARIRRIRTCFRVLMTHDSWVKRSHVKNAIKKFMFRRVDGIETPGPDGKAYAMRCGTPEERIGYATHTVDQEHYRSVSSEARPQRDLMRKQLGLQGTVYIYVGRLWWGKGIGYLLDAFEIVQSESDTEVSLLLVGDGNEEGRLRQAIQEKQLRNIVFAGFRQKQELPRYYAIADVFVFPTLGDPYGIVIDEAMASSLPVISTSAAGEILSRVSDGGNGYVVPPGDSVAMAQRMLSLAGQPDACRKMGMESARMVKDHTPENWAKDFEDIVSGLLSNNRKVS